jgi:voltage-gated potassium channel Kch
MASENLGRMGSGELAPEPQRSSLVDRRIRKVADARSVTFGLAVTFIALAFVGAIVIEIVDRHDFTSFGSAVWWALQTVTTVGYGDIVPTTMIGQVVGGIEMGGLMILRVAALLSRGDLPRGLMTAFRPVCLIQRS